MRTAALTVGRQADSECCRQPVLAALQQAQQRGGELTASSIARQARVDRTFLYRHRDLLQWGERDQSTPLDVS